MRRREDAENDETRHCRAPAASAASVGAELHAVRRIFGAHARHAAACAAHHCAALPLHADGNAQHSADRVVGAAADGGGGALPPGRPRPALPNAGRPRAQLSAAALRGVCADVCAPARACRPHLFSHRLGCGHHARPCHAARARRPHRPQRLVLQYLPQQRDAHAPAGGALSPGRPLGRAGAAAPHFYQRGGGGLGGARRALRLPPHTQPVCRMLCAGGGHGAGCALAGGGRRVARRSLRSRRGRSSRTATR